MKARNDLIVASEHKVKIPVPSQTGLDFVGLVLMQMERIIFFFPPKVSSQVASIEHFISLNSLLLQGQLQ